MKPQKIPRNFLSFKIESEEKRKCDNRKLLANPKICEIHKNSQHFNKIEPIYCSI